MGVLRGLSDQLGLHCRATTNQEQRESCNTAPWLNTSLAGFKAFGMILSSSERKAQESFSDQNLSVVRRCCCRGVGVNFSHFQLLLKNHWVIFNQTWHKALKGIQVCSNEEPRPFPRGDNYK